MGETRAGILTLVEEYNRSDTLFVFTDGSVRKGVKSGWVYSTVQDRMEFCLALRSSSPPPEMNQELW